MSANDRNAHFDALFSSPGLLAMGQNTNHLPQHPAVIEALVKSAQEGEFAAYAPPLGFEALRDAIVTDFGVADLQSIVTEGGVAALATICRARCRPGTNFVTTDPTWKWPCQFAEQAGSEVRLIPIYNPDTAYKLTAAQLEATVDEQTAIIYLVDPNNPLGITYTPEEIVAFSRIARKVGALFVHDCTYRDFADGHTPAVLIETEETVVTGSFSKWLGLAGLRVGALVANPALIDEFAAQSVEVLGGNVPAQRAALAGLGVKGEWMRDVRAVTRRNNAAIAKAARNIPGLAVPIDFSHGNFLIIETQGAGVTPEALVTAFRGENIAIRHGRYHSAALGDRFIKISTSVPEAWAERLCVLLPRMVETAREIRPAEGFF